MRQALFGEYGLVPPQVAEGAAYSLSMVLRYSLGLSSAQAQLAMVVGNGLAGLVVLAAARQMQNAGAKVKVVIPGGGLDGDLIAAVNSAQRMGVEVFNEGEFATALGAVHAVVLGIVDISAGETAKCEEVVEFLNESSIPVHCVDVPPGVDLGTGQLGPSPIYAASTIAVGAPLAALYAAREVAGRTYVCDISIPKALYKIANTDLGQIFTEQPVQQIFPKVE